MTTPAGSGCRRSAPLAFVSLAALLPFALALPPRASAQPAKLPLSPCRLSQGVQAQCGVLEVPEDRKNPGGRRIPLRVAVVPALARAPRPDPLFLLAGGPGQAASEALPAFVQILERVHKSRDLVLVDQRGTGKSNPLRCEMTPPDASLQQRMEARGFVPQRLRACLQGYHADVRLYTTTVAMQDLDEVRAALGYQQVNLWGGSYGTRAALVYLREHEGRVRSVVLDGVAPTTMRLPLHFARDAQRAMELLFRACSEEPACAGAWPHLAEHFAALLARLSEKPARTTVSDPLTGASAEVTVTRDALSGILRAVLYQEDQAALTPLVIERAWAGDYGPLVAIGSFWTSAMASSMSVGMMLSVLCTEDVPRFGDADLEADARGSFLGKGLIEEFRQACALWPRGESAPGFGEPVRSGKPVLLLSGELDPVTPPSWAEEAARTLPNSARFTVPGVGHGATPEGCVPRLVAEFLDRPEPQALDGSCVQRQRRPPFFASFAGPTP